MSVAAYCWTFALVLYTTWHRSLVSGQSSRPPSIIYVDEFTTVKIPWTYTSVGNVYDISWEYSSSVDGPFIRIYSVNGQGKPVLNDTSPGRLEGRLEYIGGNTKKDATLAIRKFRKQDEGLFKVKFFGDTSLLDVLTTLQVIVLANVTEFKANQSEIKEGDSVILSCKVTKGLPDPPIKMWKSKTKLNESIASNSSATTLYHLITGISSDSAGLYVCRVTTRGYVSEKVYTMDVKYAPKFTTSAKMQYGCIGEMIQLNCKARGNPQPKISVVMPDGSTADMLYIKLKKFGVYRCEAINNLGNDSHAITVSEAKEKPVKPSFSNCQFEHLIWKTLPQGVMVTLQFKEQNSEGPWRDVKTTLDSNYIPKNNDSFSDKEYYEFRLIASNCVGNETSKTCIVDGRHPSAGERSSNNAGLIAGIVIGVLILIILIIVIIVVLHKRGSLPMRNRKAKQLMTTSPNNTSTNAQTTNSHKPDQLLHSDLDRDDEASPARPGYSEIAEPDNPDAPTYSNNIPSWV